MPTSLLSTSYKSYFPYLGFPANEILRARTESQVKQYERKKLGWETAIRAAEKFSGGKRCYKGEGTGHVKKKYSEEKGYYNMCYWVQVEECSKQWVVRFPLMGMMSEDTTRQRLRSEVATLQFLAAKTKVPVPKIIGYWEGDNELPPFTITENIDGIMLGLAMLRDIPPNLLNKIFKDLATIQLELLSHPSEYIGMLDISEDGTSHSPSPTLGPYSMDAMALELDGVYTLRSKPFTSSHDYYQFKLDVWNQRLDGQQNAFSDIKDGRRLALNESILREFLTKDALLRYDTNQFYLCHPDLHSRNVILDKSFHIAGIIDWEGACFLPLASACTPPQALFLFPISRLQPMSPYFTEFESKTKRYIKILSEAESHSSVTRLFKKPFSELMTTYMEDKSFFLMRGLDDLRYLDDMVWQHLAPLLYPELEVRIAKAISDNKESQTDETTDVAERTSIAVDNVLRAFAEEQLQSQPGRLQEIESWVEGRLKDCDDYDQQLKDFRRTEEGVLEATKDLENLNLKRD